MDHRMKYFSVKAKSEGGTFFPILNNIVFELAKRAEAYSQFGNLFSFFSELKSTASDTVKKKCKQLDNMHHEGLNYYDLSNECEHLKHYVASRIKL